MLKTLEFQVDGKPSKDFPESFSEIVFSKSGKNLIDVTEKTFSFERYIIYYIRKFGKNKGFYIKEKKNGRYFKRNNAKSKKIRQNNRSS